MKDKAAGKVPRFQVGDTYGTPWETSWETSRRKGGKHSQMGHTLADKLGDTVGRLGDTH